MSNITVVGGGYVGLVTAACFVRLGHTVSCIEVERNRLRTIAAGQLPIREPGLEDLWQLALASGRLRVLPAYDEAAASAKFIFIAVGTPPLDDGRPDLRQIDGATKELARALPHGERPIVVIKSTVPLGTAERVAVILERGGHHGVPVISNPEFLREGQAVLDFMRPSRVIIGGDDAEARDAVACLYQPLKRPVIHCSNRAAELIKYASNAFLCTKVSFINELAAICELSGVDVREVSHALGMDSRIGHSYLDAGLGWGGSCLPKDVRALIATANGLGLVTPLLDAAIFVNRQQPFRVLEKLSHLMGGIRGRTVCVLGLSFKPNCDDVRDSPALALIRLLLAQGAKVRAFDPLSMANAAAALPEVEYCPDAYEAAREADAIVLATDWSVFEHLDFDRLALEVAGRVFVDARNAFDAGRVTAAGFVYTGLGRGERTCSGTPSTHSAPIVASEQRGGSGA